VVIDQDGVAENAEATVATPSGPTMVHHRVVDDLGVLHAWSHLHGLKPGEDRQFQWN
jgi:hypothetical protein